MAIPVKLGERVVGEATFDDDGFIHIRINEDDEDVRDFLGEHHALTYLSLADDGESASLELSDDVATD